jgi:hypothetical protein
MFIKAHPSHLLALSKEAYADAGLFVDANAETFAACEPVDIRDDVSSNPVNRLDLLNRHFECTKLTALGRGRSR